MIIAELIESLLFFLTTYIIPFFLIIIPVGVMIALILYLFKKAFLGYGFNTPKTKSSFKIIEGKRTCELCLTVALKEDVFCMNCGFDLENNLQKNAKKELNTSY